MATKTECTEIFENWHTLSGREQSDAVQSLVWEDIKYHPKFVDFVEMLFRNNRQNLLKELEIFRGKKIDPVLTIEGFTLMADRFGKIHRATYMDYSWG